MRRTTRLMSLLLGVEALPQIRLYTPRQALVREQALTLSDGQRHYLLSVMRAKVGGKVALFNGEDGEWSAAIEALDKRTCELRVLEQLRQQPDEASGAPTLLFGVLKGARLPTLVEKAVELGVGSLRPVVTQHCAARKVNVERLQNIATEAAEQSRRLTVPDVSEPEALAAALAAWDPERPLCVCDERGDAPPLSWLSTRGVLGASPGVLVGPEGGFSADEFEQLEAMPCVTPVSLGQNTLRAETAALAACAILACR